MMMKLINDYEFGHIQQPDFVVPCDNHQPVFVINIMADGRKQLRMQCLTCGKVESKVYKMNLVNNLSDVPLLDIELRQKYRNNEEEIRLSYYKARSEQKEEKYKQYLESPEWKTKRDMILKKYNCKCVLCFSKAVDVHHLTYARIYNEDERDLIPLCRSCHKFIHSIDDAPEQAGEAEPVS